MHLCSVLLCCSLILQFCACSLKNKSHTLKSILRTGTKVQLSCGNCPWWALFHGWLFFMLGKCLGNRMEEFSCGKFPGPISSRFGVSLEHKLNQVEKISQGRGRNYVSCVEKQCAAMDAACKHYHHVIKSCLLQNFCCMHSVGAFWLSVGHVFRFPLASTVHETVAGTMQVGSVTAHSHVQVTS